MAFLISSIVGPCVESARVRAGVARARRDLARLGQALDEYFVDYGDYPPSVESPERTRIPPPIYRETLAPPKVSHRQALIPLTTPVAYLKRVDFDAPFPAMAWEIAEAEERSEPKSYWYCNFGDFHRTARWRLAPRPRLGYMLMAFGPFSRGVHGISAAYGDMFAQMSSAPAFFLRPNANYVYDPTNGTISNGNIMRFGGLIHVEDGVPYIP